MNLECVTIEPKQPATASIIWLHGLGADGHDFVDIVPQLNLDLPLRFIFPHAPVRPITLNNNMEMRAWFDVHNLGETTIASKGESITKDEAGVKQSQQFVEELIDHEINQGIPSNKIILAGFSQGGSIALYTGLHFAKPLAGILALSTCLPSASELASYDSTNAKTPIMIAHGVHDPVIPLALAEHTYQLLKDLKFPVSFHEYPMEHAVCPQEINDISQWIRGIL